jgi:hypothetical protein
LPDPERPVRITNSDATAGTTASFFLAALGAMGFGSRLRGMGPS